jgi:chorismate synthase
MRMSSSRRTRTGSFAGRSASFAAAYGVGYSSRELRERSQAVARAAAAAVAGSSPPKEVVAELGLQRSSSLSDLQHSSGGTVVGSDSLHQQQQQSAQGMLPVYPMRKSRSSEWEACLEDITDAEAMLWQP